MRLTARDHELLKLLKNYGCLTTQQIQTKTFNNIALTTVLRRLRVLNETGLVQKILGLETSERLWALTKQSVERFELAPAKVNFPRAILEHDALLSTVRMRLEDSGISRSWIPEHDIRKRVAAKHGVANIQRRVIPDGAMSSLIGNEIKSIAIELELSNKNQERYRQILWDYSRKKSLYAVWYIVATKTIQKQIEHAIRDVHFYETSPKILFSVLGEILNDPLEAAIVSGRNTQTARTCFASESAHPDAHRVSGLRPASEDSHTQANPS